MEEESVFDRAIREMFGDDAKDLGTMITDGNGLIYRTPPANISLEPYQPKAFPSYVYLDDELSNIDAASAALGLDLRHLLDEEIVVGTEIKIQANHHTCVMRVVKAPSTSVIATEVDHPKETQVSKEGRQVVVVLGTGHVGNVDLNAILRAAGYDPLSDVEVRYQTNVPLDMIDRPCSAPKIERPKLRPDKGYNRNQFRQLQARLTHQRLAAAAKARKKK